VAHPIDFDGGSDDDRVRLQPHAESAGDDRTEKSPVVARRAKGCERAQLPSQQLATLLTSRRVPSDVSPGSVA
jgi:hypothetical protein